MDSDSERAPEFEEVRTKDPEEAVDAIFGPAMAATPALTEEQYHAAFQSLRNSWGDLPLVQGSSDEIRAILSRNARDIAAQAGFREFQVSLIAGPEYVGEEAIQIYAWFPSEGRIVRAWKTEQAFYVFGTPRFLAITTPPGLIEVPNRLGIGDGTPLLVEEEPDLERILADPDPQPPQRISDRNRDLWAGRSPEQIRTTLVAAYLAHPRAAVRMETLKVAGNRADGSQVADLLVDRSTRVRSAAAEMLWDQSTAPAPESTMLAFAIRVLHDEVKRTGLVSHMSAAQALEALRLLQRTRPQRRDDFNKWLVDAWVREEEALAVQGFRLLDLHGREGTFAGPAESEAREIGAELDRAGGLQAMEAIREAIEVGLGEATADELTLSWQGVGPWPEAETPEEAEEAKEVAKAPAPPAPEIEPTEPATAPPGVYCSACGHLNPASRRTCRQCGSELISRERPVAARAPEPASSQASASNGLAIASLVLGIVSLPSACCYGGGALLGIGSLVLGFLARRQIRESGGTQQGDGLAVAGMVTGGIAILGGVLWVVLLALGLIFGGQ